jgi:hypothetical protein
MKKVWIVESEKNYAEILSKSLLDTTPETDSSVHEVLAISQCDALENLQHALFAEQENSLNLSVIVDGEQAEFLCSLNQVIHGNES